MSTKIQPMFGTSTANPLFAQFTITGKVELFLDKDCKVHESGGYIQDGYELLSFCYLRNLNIIPLGLGRMQLVPMWQSNYGRDVNLPFDRDISEVKERKL